MWQRMAGDRVREGVSREGLFELTRVKTGMMKRSKKLKDRGHEHFYQRGESKCKGTEAGINGGVQRIARV